MVKFNVFFCFSSFILITNISISQNRCLERLKQEAGKIDSIQYSTGTGFLINNDGYIMTNRHVIERAKELTVTFTISGKKVERIAEIIGYSTFDDLALIKVDIKNLFTSVSPYSFKKEQLNIGSKIYTMGYPVPSYMGTNIKLTDGMVNATTGFQDSESEYQISAPIQGGNSGSPMFDGEGFIRGVIVSSYDEGQNVNYSIKSQKLIELLDKFKIKYTNAKPAISFMTNLNAIQSRICMITNMSVKTYYKEFNTSSLNQNDNSQNMMSKSTLSNSEYFDCFKNNRFEPEQDFKTIEEQIIYKSRFLNTNGFNGLDAINFFGQLYDYGAYENIIEENNKFFDFNTQEIQFIWFHDYVSAEYFNFFDVYYWATIYQYADYDANKLLELDGFINYLIDLNDDFKNQVVLEGFSGKTISKVDQKKWTNESFANLLQYKLNLIYIREDITKDKCDFYNQIKGLLTTDKIWVKQPNCN